MNLKKHNVLFFLVVSIVSIILFKTTVMDKMSFQSNGFSDEFNHVTANSILIVYFLILNLFLHKKHVLKTLLFIVITAILSFVLAYVTFGILMNVLRFLDKNRTPLGWSFNYQWFTMIFLSAYLIISTNWIHKRMNRQSS